MLVVRLDLLAPLVRVTDKTDTLRIAPAARNASVVESSDIND